MKREKTTSQIFLKEPKYEDLWYRKQLLGDANNMSFFKGYDFKKDDYNFNDGTIDFDETKWTDWYKLWLRPGRKNRYYAYVVRKEDGKFLGETFFVFDDESETYDARILLEESARKLGYANEIVDLLMMEAFDKGMQTFYTMIPRERFDSTFYKKRNFKEIRPGRSLTKNGNEIETVLIGVDKNDYMKYLYGNSFKYNVGQVVKKIFK